MVCVCVYGFVVVGLWLKWLVLLGFRCVFFFFFNMGFCFGEILVSSGQWWLGFFWVFVPMGLCVCVCVFKVFGFVCVCVFVWIFVCVCSDGFLGF